MKALISSLLAVSGAVAVLASSGVASAQDHHDGQHPQPGGEHHSDGGRSNGGGHPSGQPGGAPHGPPAGAVRPQSAPQAPAQAAPGGQGGSRPTFPGGQGGYRPQGAAGQTPPGGQGGYRGQGSAGQNLPGGQDGYRGQGYQGQAYGGRQGQYQGQGQGQRFQGGQRQGFSGGGGGRSFSYRGGSHGAFRAAPYRFPRGYGYTRFSVHQRFPSYFLLSSYYLNDWGEYYLSAPPGPDYRWVRYGPDAVLVDVYSGDIVDVAYGVFYDGGDDGDPDDY